MNGGSQLHRTNVPSRADAESGHFFTVSSLPLQTTVSDVSVRALNYAGWGEAAMLPPIVITTEVDGTLPVPDVTNSDDRSNNQGIASPWLLVITLIIMSPPTENP